MRRIAALIGLALAAACNSEDSTPLPMVGRDAAVPADTGAADTGVVSDSGTSTAAHDAGVIVGDECDPVAQSGCPATASKCVVENPMANGGTRCVPENGMEKALGETCSGRECEGGLVCVRTGTAATCNRACDPSAGGRGCEGMANTTCRRIQSSNWGYCSGLPAPCNVMTHEPCAANEACQPYTRGGGVFELRCRPAGVGDHGDLCDESRNRCARGFVCVRVGLTGRVECRKVCANNADCSAIPNMSMCNGSISALGITYCHP